MVSFTLGRLSAYTALVIIVLGTSVACGEMVAGLL